MNRTFNVWYQKKFGFYFRDGEDKLLESIDPQNLEATHTFLKEEEAEDLEDLYRKMQGEYWSPWGEARDLIRTRGLSHTSMSVGDVAVLDGRTFVCVNVGWKEVPAKKKRVAA